MAGTAIYVTADSLGRPNEELGKILMPAFLDVLSKGEQLPDRICFTNAGVKLVCRGSTVLDSLNVLAGKGVELLACGTCLDYYNLTAEVEVGRVSNMVEIVGSLMAADKVVTI